MLGWDSYLVMGPEFNWVLTGAGKTLRFDGPDGVFISLIFKFSNTKLRMQLVKTGTCSRRLELIF